MGNKRVNTMKPLTTTVTITMELEMKLEIEKLADRYDTNKSSIVRLAVEQFIRKVKNTEIKIKKL